MNEDELRAIFEASVRGVLDEQARACETAHVELAATAWERFIAAVRLPKEEDDDMALGLRGTGVWLRNFKDMTPVQAADALDVVVISYRNSRGALARGATAQSWVREYRSLGGRVWAMDWLPHAAIWQNPTAEDVRKLDALCAYAASQGCLGIMADLEPDAGWRDDVRAATNYVTALAAGAKRHGLKTGVTDYGRGGDSAAVMRVLLEAVDVGIPQSYDPNGSYVANYHERSVDYWKERGAKRVVLGYGIWLRGERRHRTAPELVRHLQHVPPGVCGVIGWYGAQRSDGLHRVLQNLLPTLKAYQPPGGKTNALLDNLTPFGSLLRDELDGC